MHFSDECSFREVKLRCDFLVQTFVQFLQEMEDCNVSHAISNIPCQVWLTIKEPNIRDESEFVSYSLLLIHNRDVVIKNCVTKEWDTSLPDLPFLPPQFIYPDTGKLVP